MPDGDLDTAELPGHVDTDLACATCGYNLRTLRWDGLCPECGRPMRDSVLPNDLDFGSYQAIRRTRVGIALWIVALTAPAVGLTVYTLVILNCKPLFLGSPSEKAFWGGLLRFGAHVWGWSSSVAIVVQATAVALFIARPGGLGWDRADPRLALVATVSAVVSAACAVLVEATYWSGYGASVFPAMMRLVADMTFGASLILAWVYLSRRLDEGKCRGLRRAMWLGLVAPSLIAASELASGACWLLYPSFWVGSAGPFAESYTNWWSRLSQGLLRWDKQGRSACAILMLLVLLAYLRKLDSALRRKA